VRWIASVAVCLALAACAAPAPLESDWQRAQEAKNWHEGQVVLPAYPKRGNLVEFVPGPRTDFRFFVDPTSLSVGPDGVVRYVLVARSPQGAESVSYEGLHCSDEQYKVYATGRPDGRWVEARGARWRSVAQRAGPWRRTLAEDFFCPGNSPIFTAAEGVKALRHGGNPRAAKLTY
jgi:hypothetical protein